MSAYQAVAERNQRAYSLSKPYVRLLSCCLIIDSVQQRRHLVTTSTGPVFAYFKAATSLNFSYQFAYTLIYTLVKRELLPCYVVLV